MNILGQIPKWVVLGGWYGGIALEKIFDVTSAGGTIREGELFTFGDFGDLTGKTGCTIDGVACTSFVLNADNATGQTVAPADGVRYNEPVAIRFT